MNVLYLILALLTSWGPQERSGEERHPVMEFNDLVMEDSALAYDVTNYRLVFDVDIPAESISAEAEITLKTLESLDSIRLHFAGMEVSGVEVDGEARTFSRADSFLVVSLGSTVSKDTELALKVYYHGEPVPASGGFGGGLYIDPGEGAVTYACNAPWGAKHWFPCQDNPADKASMEMIVIVPEGYEVISNGKLNSADRTGPYWTFHWQEAHPIATYLIVFAASANYALTQDTAWIDDNLLVIENWVLCKDSAEVTPKLMVATEILEYFSSLFYPYPFADEKYAQVHFSLRGAMENQTCTHINTHIDWGDWDVIVAHELSHSWWGNSTTCRQLKHMWLNEGFATYCEALWIEHRDGADAYQQYYEDDIAAVYLRKFAAHQNPILDPPWSQIYSALTYEKPACVLHMLRRLVGDDDFFTILRTYGQRYQDSTALSEDFEAVVDEVTGVDFSWFFNQWLRSPGHPEYLVTWDSEPVDDSVRVILHLQQTQEWPPEVPVFRMPVEFGLVSGTDTSFVTFIDSLVDQSFEVVRDIAPDDVVFDPHGNLLCKIEYSGIAEESHEHTQFTCSAIIKDRLEYAFGSEMLIGLAVYDVSGRQVAGWEGIPSHGSLKVEHLSAGVYFVKVLGKRVQTRRIVIIK